MFREIYLLYKETHRKKRKELIRQKAIENNMTVQEVVEGIMPYILAEKPENRFGNAVLIVGSLDDEKPFKEAVERLEGRTIYSLYDYKGYKDEDIIALIRVKYYDTVYFLNGWDKNKLCHKIKAHALKERKIQCYQEYEVTDSAETDKALMVELL